MAFLNHAHYLYSGFGDCISPKHHSMPGPILALGGEVPVILDDVSY